jgi:protein-tyrosine phosphatase
MTKAAKGEHAPRIALKWHEIKRFNERELRNEAFEVFYYLSLTEAEEMVIDAAVRATIFEEEADKIVCQWSMAEGVALTESQLNSLVNRIAHRFDDAN